jgi:phage head maturation protease
MKAEELRQPDYAVRAITALDELFDLAIANTPALPTSGMVEMQRYFAMLREKRNANR